MSIHLDSHNLTIMANSLLTQTSSPATTGLPISRVRSKQSGHSQSLGFHRVSTFCRDSDQAPGHKLLVNRRNLAFGLVGVVLGSTEKTANAAARRPPPPPPAEKKDPNVSGLMAKVLASKKRKEAMKENVAKLREQGKAITPPSK